MALDIRPHNSYLIKIPLAKGRLSRGYSLGRSGSGSRRARRYTALAGGLGIVPSGACRTARCSLHWCRRGSSRLHPVVPGSAAQAEPRPKRPRMPRWGAERRARPLHEVPATSVPSRGKGERTRAASLFDADPARAYRRSASLLLREEFFGRRFLAGLFLAWAKLGCAAASRQR